MSAARLHRFCLSRQRQVHLTFARGDYRRTSHPLIVTHGVTSLGEEDVMKVEGLRVTKAARTILDVCSIEDIKVTEDIVEGALRRNRAVLEQLEQLVARSNRGVPGYSVLRRIVQNHCGVPTESDLEKWFSRFLEARRFPSPQRQFAVFDEDGFIGRLDFAYPEHKIAIEIESFEWHGTDRISFDRDTERFNRLVAAQWKPLRITSTALGAPARLERRLRKMRGEMLPGF